MWAHPAGYCFKVAYADVDGPSMVETRWLRTKRLERAVGMLAMRLPWSDWDDNPPNLPRPQATDFDAAGNLDVWLLDLRRCDGAPLPWREAKYVADRFDLDLPPPYDNRKFWTKEWRRQAPIERRKWYLERLLAQKRVP